MLRSLSPASRFRYLRVLRGTRPRRVSRAIKVLAGTEGTNSRTSRAGLESAGFAVLLDAPEQMALLGQRECLAWGLQGRKDQAAKTRQRVRRASAEAKDRKASAEAKVRQPQSWQTNRASLDLWENRETPDQGVRREGLGRRAKDRRLQTLSRATLLRRASLETLANRGAKANEARRARQARSQRSRHRWALWGRAAFRETPAWMDRRVRLETQAVLEILERRGLMVRLELMGKMVEMERRVVLDVAEIQGLKGLKGHLVHPGMLVARGQAEIKGSQVVQAKRESRVRGLAMLLELSGPRAQEVSQDLKESKVRKEPPAVPAKTVPPVLPALPAPPGRQGPTAL